MGDGRKIRPRIELTDFECEMLDGMAAIMKLGGRRRSRAAYGETLVAFFRLVVDYADAEQGTDFARKIGQMIEESGRKRRYVRRGLLPAAAVRSEMAYNRDATAKHLERENYTVQEAHAEALLVEATRLIKEANVAAKAAKKRRRAKSRV